MVGNEDYNNSVLLMHQVERCRTGGKRIQNTSHSKVRQVTKSGLQCLRVIEDQGEFKMTHSEMSIFVVWKAPFTHDGQKALPRTLDLGRVSLV